MRIRTALLCALAGAVLPATAKPISFGDGWTLMGEYSGETLREAQVFYAPKYWWSAGVSATKLIGEHDSLEREYAGPQVNYLVKRWNLPAAQGNIFASLGAGVTKGFDHHESFSGEATVRYALQADYETRRIYTSAKTEWLQSSRFTHGINTVQVGIAPFEHDYEDLAVWFVVQARRYTGGIKDGTEVMPVLRLFKGNFWIEGGVDKDGNGSVMVMMNF